MRRFAFSEYVGTQMTRILRIYTDFFVCAIQSKFGVTGFKDFWDFRRILIQKIRKSDESKF